MGKAKIASETKTKGVARVNYDDYIRFGYILPNGLVVTKEGGQLGSGEVDTNGDPVPMRHSFIDMMPVSIKDKVEFNHLADVMVFAALELRDREIAADKAREELIADEARQQAEYENNRALNNQLMEEQIQQEIATGVVDAEGNYLPDAGDVAE